MKNGITNSLVMHRLSRRVLAASESQTLAIAARAKQMKQQGIDVVSLATGEPDFATPACAKHAAIEAIQNNFSHYTEAIGIPELRRVVAEKFRRENNIACADESSVLISCGAKHSIMNALSAMCNAGDEVIIPAPYWVSYPAMATIADAHPVIVNSNADEQFKITAKQLEHALTDKTKCVIFNSPSNPTGMMYTQSEFENLAAFRYSSICLFE